MRAAVYRGARNVAVESVADPPPPGPDEVVLHVSHASICGTDAAEWWDGPHLISLSKTHAVTGNAGPVVLGHEFVGEVASVGAEVTNLHVGDRVVSGAGVSCGACSWCRSGRTNLCERYYTLGLQADGGLAELVTTPAHICVPVPDGCDDVSASIAQPLAVARHALTRGAARSGEALAVIGVGGIGSFIIACGVDAGMSPVIAVDVNQRRLETARLLGASDVVDARSESPAAAIRAATDGDGSRHGRRGIRQPPPHRRPRSLRPGGEDASSCSACSTLPMRSTCSHSRSPRSSSSRALLTSATPTCRARSRCSRAATSLRRSSIA